MRFKTKSGDYAIVFNYTKMSLTTEVGPVRNKQLRQTKCKMFKLSNPEARLDTPDATVIAEAQSLQSLHDGDNKFVARKIALTRALDRAKFDKHERGEIWQQYLQLVNLP